MREKKKNKGNIEYKIIIWNKNNLILLCEVYGLDACIIEAGFRPVLLRKARKL